MFRPYVVALKKKLGKFERARLKLNSAGICICKGKPDGSKSYQGGPNLRSTQVYPRKFAAKLFKMHAKLKARLDPGAATN